MTAVFVSLVTIIIFLYLKSGNRFNEELSLLDSGKKRYRGLISAGLQLGELFNHKYDTAYEKRLQRKLCELKGDKNSRVLLKLHIAEKIAHALLLTAAFAFIGMQVEVDSSFMVFCLVVTGAVLYATDRQLDNDIRDKRRSMQLEFPEFLNKLILLVNAGLTVSGAIRKIARDNKKEAPLYTELGFAINELNSGKAEYLVYEDFARRCRMQEVNMFASALIQNLRKGSDELVAILRLQSAACWESRKNTAKKLGEEASTKLIIPMILIFIAILIMIITPAVLQLKL